jgi:hypothetical protein
MKLDNTTSAGDTEMKSSLEETYVYKQENNKIVREQCLRA